MKRVFTANEKIHGSGSVIFKWQRLSGNYIATAGSNGTVNIFDRHGEMKEQFQLQGNCIGLDWDKHGDTLAMINEKTPFVFLWDNNTGKVTQVDTGLRDTPSILTWSKTSNMLAIGTSKGNLLIYNHQTSRKIPVVGKHSKRITCGVWNQQNLLALGSDDKTMTISNVDGDNLQVAALRADPSEMQFSEMKQDQRSLGENTVSMILGKKTLFLFNLKDADNPVELAFQPRYGNLIDYKWFGDGYILLGFSNGYFVAISTHVKEIGQELFQTKNHHDMLTHVAVSFPLGKAASCGDNCIKVHELANLREMFNVLTLDDERALDEIDWSPDGQLLAVSSTTGNVHMYLSKLPILGDSCSTRIAYLTSLLEVTVVNNVEQERPVSISVEVEPSFIALGPFHLAIGMNNRAWFYLFGDSGPELWREREYLGTIESMKLNGDYASVLFEGKLQLNMIESEGSEMEERESKLFPDKDNLDIRITCHAITSDFLIYGTDMGSIHFFFLEDWQFVNEYRHSVGIRYLFPELVGTHLAVIDEQNNGLIYNPVNDQTVDMPNLPSKVKGILWEIWPVDKDVFVAYDDSKVITYFYGRESLNGTKVEYIGETKLPFGQHPVLLYNGELTCQTQSGKLSNLLLTTHDSDEKLQEYKADELKEALKRNIALHKFKEVWAICQSLSEKGCWEQFAAAALNNLDIELAIRIYHHVGDVGMVWSLAGVKSIEDRNLLAGHVAMFLGQFNEAQELYLKSSNPVAALEMRRDLLHWDQALHLARTLAPNQIPFISREFAQQLEFTGDYPNALLHFEKGLVHEEIDEEHDTICKAGIARMAIRCGDIRRGINQAEQLESRALKKECAEILENMKQFAEAAALYESGKYWDKSAVLYIRLKNWMKIGELLPLITSPKIHIQYAKAKEADGSFKDAAKAYEAAHDYDNVVRIYLDHLKNPEDAVKIVRETKSMEGAKMVAKFFQKLNDFDSAIQFLVLSKCNDEAFQLAQNHGKMDIYAQVIGDDATIDDYNSIALYFENEKKSLLAGKFYYLSGKYSKAMKHLLRANNSDEHESIMYAIDVIKASADDQLSRLLIEYLMGETDGIPKDAKYLFQLFMARKQYREAAKTATIIAREDQNSGNYRSAHDVLFGMYQELKKQKIKIPSEMNYNLMLLHSYILVKVHVKRNDHLKCARLLIRVANNISKFQSHVVPILTSTVIECHRSGLKNSAFNFAAMLLRPEYKGEIDGKYKKKIEAIVRKPQKSEEEEPKSECPYCSMLLIETELVCSSCKNNLPFCIVTGRHIVISDLTCCPNCKFPAIYTEFKSLLESDESCPMCSMSIKAEKLRKLDDPAPFLHSEENE